MRSGNERSIKTSERTTPMALLRSFSNLRINDALGKIGELKLEDIFSPEERANSVSLDEAHKDLISYWETRSEQYAQPIIEKAIIERVNLLYGLAHNNAPLPVIKATETSEPFPRAFGELVEQLPSTDKEKVSEKIQKGEKETDAVMVAFLLFMSQGKQMEAVTLMQNYALKLFNDMGNALLDLQKIKEEMLEGLDGPNVLKILTGGHAELTPDADDVIRRTKKVVTEFFGGTDMGFKADLLQTVMAAGAVAEDVDIKKEIVSVAGGYKLKKTLDSNTLLEEKYGLGLMDPDSKLLRVSYVAKTDIKQMHRDLTSKSQAGLNTFLQAYSGKKIYDINSANEISAVIMEQFSNVCSFVTLCTLMKLDFFEKPKSDISDVANKVSLEELYSLTIDELVKILEDAKTTPYLGDAFRKVLDEKAYVTK
ncbi:MAG: hypothetical protein AAB947_00710 [Patescibacteria group bacterium]